MIPDILMFMRRIGNLHPEQMASIAKYTLRSFNLYVEFTPWEVTAFQAVNRVMARSKSRWMCLIDDDVVFQEPHWLDVLIGYLEKHADLAAVTPMELKTPEQLSMFRQDRSLVVPPGSPRLIETTWNAGYVCVYDREKMPDLYCDEQIPGRYGASDVDMVLQARHRGFRSAITTDTIVYHPFKPVDHTWRKQNDIITEEDGAEMHKLHVEYMVKKWGQFYIDNAQHRILGTIE